MNKIDVCLSPELLHLYNLEESIVVVVDIFRATSCMTTAFAHGVKEILPVATISECESYKEKGYLLTAEREGKTPEGFDFDNSPFSYMTDKVKDAKICVTTTNGTIAITKSKYAKEVLIGSFLNIDFLSNYLKTKQNDILILCAGWKGKPNIEDTLFAGALIDKMDLETKDDSALMAHRQYLEAKSDTFKYVQKSAHVSRLKNIGIEKDIAFCMTMNKYNVLPILKGNILVNIQ